jgi:hypothetical protein
VSSDELFLVTLLRALRDARLEAVVVGSVAAVLQGAPVTTQDIDILVRDTPANRGKVDDLAAAIGARTMPAALADVCSLIGAATAVDVVFDHLPGGLRFESVRARAVEVEVGGLLARVASLDDVIASKRAADRPKDRAQLPLIEETRRVLGQVTRR